MNTLRKTLLALLCALYTLSTFAAAIVGPSSTATPGAIGFNTQPYYHTAGYTGPASGNLGQLQVNIPAWNDVTGLKIVMHSADGAAQRTATFTPADGTGILSKSITSYAYTSPDVVYFVIYTTGGGGLVDSYRQGAAFESSIPAPGATYASPATTINPVTDDDEQVPNGFWIVADGTIGGGGGLLLRRRRS